LRGGERRGEASALAAAANQAQAGQNGAAGQKPGAAGNGQQPDDRIAVVSLIDGAAFQDPVLMNLLQRLQSGNLSMVQAEARLRQAQATLSGKSQW